MNIELDIEDWNTIISELLSSNRKEIIDVGEKLADKVASKIG